MRVLRAHVSPGAPRGVPGARVWWEELDDRGGEADGDPGSEEKQAGGSAVPGSSSRLSGGGGLGSRGGGVSVQAPSFSRYMEGTYRAGTARSDPMKKLPTDYEDLKYLWDYRLTEYARKAYMQKRIT